MFRKWSHCFLPSAAPPQPKVCPRITRTCGTGISNLCAQRNCTQVSLPTKHSKNARNKEAHFRVVSFV